MSYLKLDLQQGSPEWLAARYDFVTASNMPAVLGRSPYKTQLEYATELLTRQEKKQEGKADLFARGHIAEAAARAWALDQFGIAYVPAVVRSARLECLLASLDGIDEASGLVLEAKLVGRDAFAAALTGHIPEHHEIQVQAQLLATGFPEALYVAVSESHEMAPVGVAASPALQDEIATRAPAFWSDVQAGRLPEPTARDIVEVDDEELARLATLDRTLKAALAELKPLEDEKERIEAMLKARYPSAGRLQGHGVSLTRYWSKGTVDWRTLAEHERIPTDIQERYRKAGALRTRITIK